MFWGTGLSTGRDTAEFLIGQGIGTLDENGFDISSTHLLYRILRMSGNNTSALGDACFRRLDNMLSQRREKFRYAYQRVLHCSQVPQHQSSPLTPEFAPATVNLNEMPCGVNGNKFDNIGKSSTFGNNGKGFGAQIKIPFSAT